MRSIQGGASSSSDSPTSLEDLRKGLTAGQRKIVKAVVGHIERELIETLPELNAGVQTSAASGSFTSTLQISKAKKGRFKAEIGARIRVPREKLELDMHLGSDNQLELGLPAGFGDDGGGEAGEE